MSKVGTIGAFDFQLNKEKFITDTKKEETYFNNVEMQLSSYDLYCNLAKFLG